jgi:hypothetical protein
MCDTTFRISGVDYGEVVKFFNMKTGMKLDPVFAQYVKHAALPQFQYKLMKRGDHYRIKYRWRADVNEFDMPLDVVVAGNKQRLFPSRKWKKQNLTMTNASDFKIDSQRFYIAVKKM